MIENVTGHEGDSHAQLDALYRRRDELRAAIGAETEPDVRAELLSMLKRNRANINRLSTELGVERSNPTPITTSLSKVVVDTGDHNHIGAAFDHSSFNNQSTERPLDDLPPGIPENASFPESFFQDQEAAMQPQQLGQSTMDVDHRQPGKTGFLPGFLLALALIAITALGVYTLFNVLGLSDGLSNSNAEAVASPSAQPESTRLNDMRAVLAGMSLAGIQIEEQNGSIFLTGTVISDAERDAVIGAISALAEGSPIDASQLVVTGGGPEVDDSPDDASAADRLQSEIGRVVAATPIIFDNNQTELDDLHRRILNNIATIVLAYQSPAITIVGFTDGGGEADVNDEVSLARANAVRDYLISQGVPEAGLSTEARGEDTSLGLDSVANLERRVEFEVGGTAEPADEPGAADTLKIALITPSGADDKAFSQSMVDAANLVADQRGKVDVTVADNVFVPDEAKAQIRDFASQEYDLVIAHGSQFSEAVVESAREFPDVSFAWGTASDTFDLPNIYAYDAASNEGGYVLGALAAMLSESNVVGVVGPIEVGDAERYVNGFQNGAVAELAATDVRVEYTGSFSDTTLAAEAAESHVDAGADVLTGSAQMVVGAVSVAQENDALWFGTQSNQTSLAPDRVVASQVYHWEVILAEIVADIDAGSVTGRSYTANLANGGLVIEYNPDFDVPPETLARADAIIEGIKDESIDPS